MTERVGAEGDADVTDLARDADTRWALHEGDCVPILAAMPEASVDAVVCDPPYGIADGTRCAVRKNATEVFGFSLPWDGEMPTTWIVGAYRVLRPGGAVLAFCDTRQIGTLWQAGTDAGLHPLHTFGTPGQADVQCVGPGGRFLALEAKRADGRQTEQQAAWGRMVARMGGVYAVVRSVEDALRVLEYARQRAGAPARCAHAGPADDAPDRSAGPTPTLDAPGDPTPTAPATPTPTRATPAPDNTPPAEACRGVASAAD